MLGFFFFVHIKNYKFRGRWVRDKKKMFLSLLVVGTINFITIIYLTVLYLNYDFRMLLVVRKFASKPKIEPVTYESRGSEIDIIGHRGFPLSEFPLVY